MSEDKVRLKDLPDGQLFRYKDTIALKSEYQFAYGACACYILGTGEHFWGGKTAVDELNDLLVMPIDVKEIRANRGGMSLKEATGKEEDYNRLGLLNDLKELDKQWYYSLEELRPVNREGVLVGEVFTTKHAIVNRSNNWVALMDTNMKRTLIVKPFYGFYLVFMDIQEESPEYKLLKPFYESKLSYKFSDEMLLHVLSWLTRDIKSLKEESEDE